MTDDIALMACTKLIDEIIKIIEIKGWQDIDSDDMVYQISKGRMGYSISEILEAIKEEINSFPEVLEDQREEQEEEEKAATEINTLLDCNITKENKDIIQKWEVFKESLSAVKGEGKK
jgi:hypothetical protein